MGGPAASRFWAIGALGAFTTFSAFSHELLVLLRAGRVVASFIHLVASVVGVTTVLRGMEGFGKPSTLHTAHILGLSEDLPIVIECVDKSEKIEAILPVLDGMMLTASSLWNGSMSGSTGPSGERSPEDDIRLTSTSAMSWLAFPAHGCL